MIYFFYGENDYEREQKIRAIRAKFTPENITVLSLTDADLELVSREIFGADLFRSTKLFILKDVFANADTRAFLEDFLANLNRLPDENSIILTDTKPDKRTKIFKDLLAAATAQEFPPLKDYELKKWLAGEVATRKLSLDAAAQSELVARKLGETNPQNAIALELDKLANLTGKIDAQKIRELVDDNPATNAFEILNLALDGQREKLHAEIAKLKNSSEDPNRFLGLLTSQILALAAVIFAVPDAAKTLKISPFQLTRARESFREIHATNREDFAKNLTRKLAETDAKMKLSAAEDSWILVENFLATIRNF